MKQVPILTDVHHAIAQKAKDIIERREKWDRHAELCLKARICPHDGLMLAHKRPNGLLTCPNCGSEFNIFQGMDE